MAVTDKERKLAATLSDPVLWGQAYLYNRDGSGRDYWPHQVEDLRCPAKNIIHLDGRDVGKSIVLSTDALHYAFTTRGGQGLIAAPHQGHLDTIIEEIEFQLDTNPDLMNSIALTKYGKPKIHRKPYFRLEFTNGSVLYFRPAGAYGDAFRSLHVGRVWVDEGAWLTERAITAGSGFTARIEDVSGVLPFSLHIGRFALVDPQTAHLRMLCMRLAQHRHFAPARRAPGGPQIDHQRAALIAAQLHRLAIGIAQYHFRQARAFFVKAGRQAGQQPERQPAGQPPT